MKYRLDCFDPSDRKLIKKFILEARVNGCCENTIKWYLGKLKLSRKVIKKNFESWTREDVKKLIVVISQRQYSSWTEFAYKISVKKFYQIVKGYGWHSKKYPEMVEWIRTSTNRIRYKKKYDILTEEDVQRLIDSCSSLRDRAFIGILFSSGTRAEEISNLKLKDLTWDEHGLIISVSGKTGSRRIRICKYANLLREYLEQRNSKTNAALVIEWSQSKKTQKELADKYNMTQGRVCQILKEFKQNRNHCPEESQDEYVWLTEWPRGRKLKTSGLRKILDRAKKRSGISKACNLHAFRHAFATLLSKHLSDAQMRKFFGWQFNSPMSSLYSHLSCRDTDSKIIEIFKLRENPEPRLSERVIQLERIIDRISIVQSNQTMRFRKVEDEIIAM